MIERTYICETCKGRSVGEGKEPFDRGWLFVKETGGRGRDRWRTRHFCAWDCLLKYASKYPPVERVELGAIDTE